MIYDVVNASIRPLLNPDLTASWEKRTDLCGRGKHYDRRVHGKIREFYQKTDRCGIEFKKSICPARFFLIMQPHIIKKGKRKEKRKTMKKCEIHQLYNLEETIAADIFKGVTYPWEVLPKIKDFIVELGNTLDVSVYEKRGENIWVAKSAKVAERAFLNGPLIIDEGAEVRHCAFIRGNAIVGKNCVVGNSTELKNVILFNSVQVPHYNYVGDSILGHKSHMGAGSITSNVKSDKTLVVVKDGKEEIKTGLKKFGAMLGDYVEVGCNSVLNPGTVIGAHTNVYPLSMVRGVVADHSIYKNRNEVVQKNE